MQTNLDKLDPGTLDALASVKGLKRLDKALTNENKLAVIYFDDGETSSPGIFDLLGHAQHSGYDLAICRLNTESFKADEEGLFLEAWKDFRNRIYIPLILELSHALPETMGIEKLCREIASAAIDGFTLPGLSMRKYRDDYQKSTEQFGLSYIFQNDDPEELEEIDRSGTFPGTLFWVRNSAVAKDAMKFSTMPIISDIGHHENIPSIKGLVTLFPTKENGTINSQVTAIEMDKLAAIVKTALKK